MFSLSLAFVDFSLPDAKTIVLLVGCFLLIVGILGGGIELEKLKVPPMEKTPRILAGLVGVILLVVALVYTFPADASASARAQSGKPDASGASVRLADTGQQASGGIAYQRSPTGAHRDEALPVFMTRDLTEADLVGKSRMDLDEMRNEIYARHGRMFSNVGIQDSFSKQPWYHGIYTPENFPPSSLSLVEQRNVVVLQERENH